MSQANLQRAKSQKNDEFYTQYADIQKEIEAYLEYDVNIFWAAQLTRNYSKYESLTMRPRKLFM